MSVTLNTWHESITCAWCEKDRECVNTTFSDGFLKDAPLCWKCLQTAFKVRQRQQQPASRPPETR